MSDNFDVNAATPKRLKDWLRSNNVTNVWMGDNPTHAELQHSERLLQQQRPWSAFAVGGST